MGISAELQAAQQRLLTLRAARGVRITGDPAPECSPLTLCSPSSEKTKPKSSSWIPALIVQDTDHPAVETSHPKTVPVYPDLALAMLRNEMAAAGRLWLLLRALDETGSGAVSIETIRVRLCERDAAWRIVGWRQMRNLLRVGAGVFWERDAGTVWLRSRVKVAAALGMQRFAVPAVALPVARLLGKIGAVRAALYATFHSGREAKPIARATLADLSGASANSQRAYERQSAVLPEAQYAVFYESHTENSWAHGYASFSIVDVNGRFGKAGERVMLRQLPNCYSGCFERATLQNRKRLNRKSADLSLSGTTGNDRGKFERRYFVRDSEKRGSGGRFWKGGYTENHGEDTEFHRGL